MKKMKVINKKKIALTGLLLAIVASGFMIFGSVLNTSDASSGTYTISGVSHKGDYANINTYYYVDGVKKTATFYSWHPFQSNGSGDYINFSRNLSEKFNFMYYMEESFGRVTIIGRKAKIYYSSKWGCPEPAEGVCIKMGNVAELDHIEIQSF